MRSINISPFEAEGWDLIIRCGDSVWTTPMHAIPTIDPIKAAGGWISVKDRLPEDGSRVLTYGNPYYDGVAAIDVCTYNSRIFQPFWEFITHWMPLPEPPKEDADD